MEYLPFILGFLITMLVMHVGKKAIAHVKRKQLESAKKQLPTVDEHGYREEYDPHFTRKMEVAEGVAGILTQCGDKNCSTCYWKARNKHSVGANYSPTEKYYHRINSFIDSLPDNLSDEEYEQKVKEFKDAQEVGRAKAAAIESEKKIAKELETREEHYATPNHLIDQYLAEGRTFDKNGNCWTDKPRVKLTNPVVDDYSSIILRQSVIKAIKSGAMVCQDTNKRLIDAKVNNRDDQIRELEHEMKVWIDQVKNLRKQLKEMDDASNFRIQK